MKYKISAKYKCFVLLFEVLGIIALLPFFYQLIPVNQDAQKIFYIDSSNPDDISKILCKNGYEVTFIDRWVLQLAETPREGWYSLNPDKNRLSFFKSIYRHKASTMSIKIYAGESSCEVIDRVAKDMKLDKNILHKEYDKRAIFKEGDIIAGEYIVARKANEKAIMDYLFTTSKIKLDSFIKRNFKCLPSKETINKLLTVASIIQKETNSINEMPLISSIIYNRLNRGMKLQMDATLNYKKMSHTVVTAQMIREDSSRYNTYKHKGLPPTPIGTITLDALHSALYPIKSDYLFFMLQKDGTHAFASTYKEHLENIKKFKNRQKS